VPVQTVSPSAFVKAPIAACSPDVSPAGGDALAPVSPPARVSTHSRRTAARRSPHPNATSASNAPIDRRIFGRVSRNLVVLVRRNDLSYW